MAIRKVIPRVGRGSAALGFAVVSYWSPDHQASATVNDLGQALAAFTATSGQALGISDPPTEIVVNGGHVAWPGFIAGGPSDPSSSSAT